MEIPTPLNEGFYIETGLKFPWALSYINNVPGIIDIVIRSRNCLYWQR